MWLKLYFFLIYKNVVYIFVFVFKNCRKNNLIISCELYFFWNKYCFGNWNFIFGIVLELTSKKI